MTDSPVPAQLPLLTCTSLVSGRETAISKLKLRGGIGEGLTLSASQMACFRHLVTVKLNQMESLPESLMKAGVEKRASPSCLKLAPSSSFSQVQPRPKWVGTLVHTPSSHLQQPGNGERVTQGGGSSSESGLWLHPKDPVGFCLQLVSFLLPDSECPSGTWRGQGTILAVGSPLSSQALPDPTPTSSTLHTTHCVKLEVGARKRVMCETP